MKDIKELQNHCLNLSNEKVQIANQTESLVKKALERLDIYDGKFMSNIKPRDDKEMDTKMANNSKRDGGRGQSAQKYE